MIVSIAQRELTELWWDGRLAVAGGLVLLLIVSSLAVGWQRQREIASERQVAQALDYDGWLGQQERHPHDAAHQGMHVFKPEPALSMVDPGIEPYVGSTIWLQAHRQSELKFRPAQDATGLQRFGSLSPAWVLQVLGPLLVIVLGFNAFAWEREQGTLRQLLSLGVPPRRLLWGKALALGVALAALLVPAGLAALAALASAGGSEGRGVLLARFGWLCSAYAAYLVFWVFVVLACSARALTSRASLFALTVIWIVSVVLAPRGLADLAQTWYPTPTRTQFEQSLGRDLSARYREAWLDAFGTETRWGPDLPLEKWGISLRVDDHAGYGVTDVHFGRLWDAFDAQRRLQEWCGLLFPVLAVRSFSMGIAATDFAHHRDFSVAAERHRRLMQDLKSDDLVDHADPLKDRHFAYQAGRELWRQVPRFAYRLPAVSVALQESWRGLLVLVAGAGLAVAAALVAVPSQRLPL